MVHMKVYIDMKPGLNGNNNKFSEVFQAGKDSRGGGEVRRRVQDPPIFFTEALVLKGGSTRKFLFQ